MKTNIPHYRALKIGSENEYVEGFYFEEPTFKATSHCLYTPDIINRIDPTTLSIHFPDMLDSEGNKIFASLSEDGKGGDIIKLQSRTGRIGIAKMIENCPVFSQGTTGMQELICKQYQFKIIGIQK